jgi:hypothetical protein
VDGEYCGREKGICGTSKGTIGSKAQGREVRAAAGAYVLNDPEASYTANFGGENDVLRFQNAHLWNVYNEISNG